MLDEPFAGLDAQAMALARSLIEEHLAAGGIVLLTTHQEVEFSAGTVQGIELRA